MGRVTRRSCAPRLEPGDAHSAPGCPQRRRLRRSCPALSWGADESIRRGPPSYAADVRFAIVHHTAGRNDYTRAEAPAIVRGIQLFHVQGNGWNDIGYNFLVDRFGTIYEGRFGGVDRNVIGAHALGFNTGSVGIALLGTYGNTKPSPARPGRDRAAHRVEARSRARRSDLVPHVHLGRQRALPERRPGAPERGLGPSRHGLHRVPGQRALRALGAIAATAARRSAGRRSSSRRPTARRLVDPRARAALAARSRGRSRSRARRAPRSRAAPGRAPPSTGPGSRPARPRAPTRGRSPPEPRGPRRACSAPAEVQRRLRSTGSPPSPRRSARTATARPTRPTVTYRLSAPANVTRRGHRRARAVSWRRWSTACGRRPGSTRCRSTAQRSRTATYNVVITARTAAGVVGAEASSRSSVNRDARLVAVAPAGFSPNGDGRKDRLAHRLHARRRPPTVRDPHRAGRPLGREPARRRRSCRHASASRGTAQRAPGLLRDGAYQRGRRGRPAGSASSRTASRSSPTRSRRASASSPGSALGSR